MAKFIINNKPWNFGKKGCFSAETLLKMRLSHFGKKPSLETIAKKKLYSPSIETRQKIKQNNVKYWLGKKRPNLFSKEAIEKIRKSSLGRTMPIESRIKLSNSRKGEKGSNWQGGKTPITEAARKNVEYRLWRESVFERDNYTCQDCFQRGGELHADHIKPFALFPELRFELSNGRTLCIPCHLKTPTFGGRTRVIALSI